MAYGNLTIRELIPERRISCARIREAIAADDILGQWSAEAPNAIRPKRLALVVRRSIWRALDIRYGNVRERLGPEPGQQIEFTVVVELCIGREWRHLTSCTTFSRTASGRITAEIDLVVGERTAGGPPITLSCILLRPRRAC